MYYQFLKIGFTYQSHDYVIFLVFKYFPHSLSPPRLIPIHTRSTHDDPKAFWRPLTLLPPPLRWSRWFVWCPLLCADFDEAGNKIGFSPFICTLFAGTTIQCIWIPLALLAAAHCSTFDWYIHLWPTMCVCLRCCAANVSAISRFCRAAVPRR